MNRRDIRLLRSYVGYPAITLVMPCDKKRIKEKFTDIVDHVSDEIMVATVLAEFDVLYDKLACPLHDYMIAFFVNKSIARFFILPFKIQEIVACEKMFVLDPIVAKLNRMNGYWVIDCTDQKMKIYEGYGSNLFALEDVSVGIRKPEHSQACDQGSFDACLGDYLQEDDKPICLIGSPEDTYIFTMDSPYRDRVVATVPNPYAVGSTMATYFSQQEGVILDKIMEGAVHYTNDLQEIIERAREGLIDQLIVEENYHLKGCEHGITQEVVIKEQCPVNFEELSIIDDVIELVRSRRASVLLVPDGVLKDYGHIIAIGSL